MADGVLSMSQRNDVREAFNKGLQDYGRGQFYKVYNEVFSGGVHGGPKTSDSAYEDIGTPMVGVRSIAKKDNILAPVQEFEAPAPKIFTVRHDDFDAGYGYYGRIILDDKLGWHKKLAASLGEAMMFGLEAVGHELFNRSADATFPTGWDNLPLASTVHKLINGDTFDNTLAAAAPDETLLTNITKFYDAVPDHLSRPFKVTGITILTHINNIRKWRQLLNATAADVAWTHPAGGANQNPNMPNMFKADLFTVIGTPYMYGTNKHVCFGPGHGLFWYKRRMRERLIKQENPERDLHAVDYIGSKGSSQANEILVIG